MSMMSFWAADYTIENLMDIFLIIVIIVSNIHFRCGRLLQILHIDSCQ